MTIGDGASVKRFSVYNVVQTYEDLFQRAVQTNGRVEPFLQQLENYDEREIAEFRAQLALSEDIAIRYLGTGMMTGASQKTIKEKIQIFLTPEHTKTHGRPIYAKEALQCGLAVEIADTRTRLWQHVYELYIRTNEFVSRDAKVHRKPDPLIPRRLSCLMQAVIGGLW